MTSALFELSNNRYQELNKSFLTAQAYDQMQHNQEEMDLKIYFRLEPEIEVAMRNVQTSEDG